jgi:N-acetylglucosamine malate deacetylase 1
VSVDVLAVGAHPDDVELGIGGLLHKLSQQGHRIVLLDLTRGEMGTRGTPELRMQEAAKAAEVLGVAERAQAGLPDGGVANTQEQQRRVIPFLRQFRPKVLLFPNEPDRHPDHAAAHALLRDANYFAGLAKIDTQQEPYRCPRSYCYHPYTEETMPSVVIDIGAHFEAKMKALQAYASQFYNPEFEGGDTKIASKEFWGSIQTRAAYWGSRIQADYAEALYADGPIAVDTLPGLFDGANL